MLSKDKHFSHKITRGARSLNSRFKAERFLLSVPGNNHVWDKRRSSVT